MATVAAVAAVVGATAAVVGTTVSILQQRKAIKLQRQQRNLEANRRRRAAIREARIARGQVVSQAALTGTAGSSAEAGALGSISSQLTSNLSFLDQATGLGNRLAGARGAANIFGSISRIGTSIFQIAGGTETLAKIITPPAPIPVGPS